MFYVSLRSILLQFSIVKGRLQILVVWIGCANRANRLIASLVHGLVTDRALSWHFTVENGDRFWALFEATLRIEDRLVARWCFMNTLESLVVSRCRCIRHLLLLWLLRLLQLLGLLGLLLSEKHVVMGDNWGLIHSELVLLELAHLRHLHQVHSFLLVDQARAVVWVVAVLRGATRFWRGRWAAWARRGCFLRRLLYRFGLRWRWRFLLGVFGRRRAWRRVFLLYYSFPFCALECESVHRWAATPVVVLATRPELAHYAEGRIRPIRVVPVVVRAVVVSLAHFHDRRSVVPIVVFARWTILTHDKFVLRVFAHMLQVALVLILVNSASASRAQ